MQEHQHKLLSISIDEHDDHVVVKVAGEADTDTADYLDSALASCTTNIVVDLSGVTFLDSAGLRTLVAGLEDAAKRGLALKLRDPSAPVRRLLEITTLTRLFSQV